MVGSGKLGFPVALAIESKGHEVLVYDVREDYVKEILQSLKYPHMEEGVQELLDKTKIRLVPLKELVKNCEIVLVAVQTPHDPKYEGITRLEKERKDFNYTHLINATKALADECLRQKSQVIVVIISTVLPKTIEREIKPLLNDYAKLVYNPYFIAMGTTVRDFLNPEFILFGTDEDDQMQLDIVERFYRTITNAPVVKTRIINAETIKVTYNTFIGMKIVFANVVMEICHKIGADVDEVMNALKLGYGRLISTRYLDGGMGDGGSCHPRDNIALSYLAEKYDLSFDWFTNLMEAREKQTEWIAQLIEQQYHKSSLPVIILGKSYKPETNLVVGSPSILLKNLLEEKGFILDIYDPFVDDLQTYQKALVSPAIFVIGTKHKQFAKCRFPKSSIVIDPFRYIPEQDDVTVIGLGRN